MTNPIAAPNASIDEARARKPLKVLLAAPRGFCAGVRRAIEAVEGALERFGPPVYVRRAIVHNLAVVRSLEAKGAIFVQELDEVPDNALVIFSAHGVSRQVIAEAERRGLRYMDAVCPLVSKIHREVAAYDREGRHILLIGHEGHPEITGTLGQIRSGAVSVVGSMDDIGALAIAADQPVAYAIQSTYSVDEAKALVDELTRRFPGIRAPSSSDICYATTNRQTALKRMVPKVDAVVVAGEAFSSNARRLAEVASASGCRSVHLVADASALDWAALGEPRSIGITAAASTPETSVAGIVDALRERFMLEVEEFGSADEGTEFKPMRLDAHA